MKNIVAISVEKIQKYIYKYIDQNQGDSETLKNIILASNNISKNILEKIQDEFKVKEDFILLLISGKVIFGSDLSIEEIKKKLVKLYREVYVEYSGNIFLNYSVFLKDNLSKKDIIKKANLVFKDSHNKVRIIEENRDLLFNFQEVRTKNFKDEIKNSGSDLDSLHAFLNNMDGLIDIESKERDSTNGKIAIVKADINDLGNIMKEIDSYNKFIKVSNILKECINLQYFDSCICSYQNNIPPQIFPFYIAGDDIFYAVNIGYLFDSIRILKKIIDEINSKIEKVLNEEENNTNVSKKYNEISIAVGITFVNNHQPVRYYKQIVEKELSVAKIMMKSDKEKLSLVGLSISGCKFNWYKKRGEDNNKSENKIPVKTNDNGKVKIKKSNGKSDGFNRFCSEIEELNNMMNDNIFTSTSLHNLLINLENEKEPERQLLYILYYCKPNLTENREFNEEFYFKNYILSQIVEDSSGKKERFFDIDKIENILIPKLKVILFFLRNNKMNVREDYAKSSNKKYITSDNKARSILLNKPINFLLKEVKSNGIENLFIKIDNIQNKRLYKTSKFEPSIFFRAKEFIEKDKKEQVITLFRNYSKNVIDVKNENDSNSPHRIKFEVEKFESEFRKTKNTVWLDRLILLFEYNKQRIIYKTYKKKYGEVKINNKKCKSMCNYGRK